MTPDEIEKDRAPEKILRDWEAQARDMDARNPMRSQILEEASIIRSDIALLTAERDAALALVAAAYEAAAAEADGWFYDPQEDKVTDCRLQDMIRALTPANALAAQAARDERMRAEGAAKAEARNAKLVEALKFYADPDLDGYDVSVTNYGLSTEDGPIIKDGGDIARAALKEIGNE